MGTGKKYRTEHMNENTTRTLPLNKGSKPTPVIVITHLSIASTADRSSDGRPINLGDFAVHLAEEGPVLLGHPLGAAGLLGRGILLGGFLFGGDTFALGCLLGGTFGLGVGFLAYIGLDIGLGVDLVLLLTVAREDKLVKVLTSALSVI